MTDLFGKPESDPDFEVFWKAYPRKVGRAAAEKAYLKAVRTTPHETLFAGLVKYRAACVGKEPQYILHASTWLNGKRWEDEVIENVLDKPLTSNEEQWRHRLKNYKKGGFWPFTWGERPEHGGSDIPPRVLREWKERQ